MNKALSYEKLDVYRVAIEFIAVTTRGSALECGAVLDVLRVLRPVELTLLEKAKTLVIREVEMLSKLSR